MLYSSKINTQPQGDANMNHQDTIDFAKASAVAALDQATEYGGMRNSIDSHRENVRETLKEHNATQYEEDAFSAFDNHINSARYAEMVVRNG